MTAQKQQPQQTRTKGYQHTRLEERTIIWSTEGSPLVELVCRFQENWICWFAQKDGCRTEGQRLSPQFLQTITSLP